MKTLISWMITDALKPLQDRIEKVTEFFETFLTDLENYNERLRALEKKVDDTWQRAERVEGTAADLTVRISTMVERIYKLEERLTSVHEFADDVDDMRRESDIKVWRILDDTSQELKSINGDVKALFKALGEAGTDIQSLDDFRISVETRLNGVDDELSGVSDRLKQLEK